MEFKDLKPGDQVYILENIGTFKKITTFNIGTVNNVSSPYDDTSINNQYLAHMLKNKLVDLDINCEGVIKKITVGANKSNITDTTIGLTISTDKNELIMLLELQCKEWENKIQLIDSYRAELNKCKNMLRQLNNDNPVSSPEEKDIIKVS